MQVYGDQRRRERTRDKIASVVERLARGDWHGALVEGGELAQGIADSELGARGCDARSPAQDAAMRILVAVARGERPDFAELNRVSLPAEIETRRAEGFAFYALYPECYAEAARALRGRRVRVIGLRSIGAPLAAVVAAALDAPLPVTVRPVGHPFRREVKLSPELERELVRDRDCAFALVDEGPGLSGSSLGAVADFLEDRGVAPERIHFFPGHAGELGPHASARHRSRWQRAPRHVMAFEHVILPRLASAFAGELSEALEPLEDISAGRWRALRFRAERDWPGANLQQERRKFLLRTRTGTWLLKFAGLGREGERTFARALALARAGFTPEIVAIQLGFIAQRWLEKSTHLDTSRHDFISSLREYLAFRGRSLRAPGHSGAPLAALLEMARHNTAEALGPKLAAKLECWRPRLAGLERGLRRVEVDGRMHAWEWLRTGARVLKTDALDHCAAHDLVGCQDIAWDAVGAEVELGPEARALAPAASAALLAFYRPCYLAFQLGSWSLGAEAHAGVPAEAARLRAQADRYAERLRRCLDERGLNRRRASRTRRRP